MPNTDVDHIRIYQDVAGQYRWTAIAANNQTVAQGESHTRREDAIRAAQAALGTDIPLRDDTTD